jgi:putative ABC transport system permease protein
MTVISDAAAPRSSSGPALPLALRLALRDLRGGFAGFTIFLICIALGTGAIGTINALSGAIRDAIERDGKILLGGDVEATLVHRRASPGELAFLKSKGNVSEVATLRAMARKEDGLGQALIDLKAVDGAYPLYGSLSFEDGSLGTMRAKGGIAADRTILEQLQLKVGDTLSIGRASFPIVAVIDHEPDRLAAGPALGGRILMPMAELDKTGLIEPGSLVRWNYRIKTLEPIPEVKQGLAVQFPQSGFLTRDSTDPSPGVKATLQRLTEFLTLVGLTAMLTGGIGVANSISSFVERRRMTIATYKSLGASRRLIFRTFLIEIGLLALFGIVAGFAIAVVVPALSLHLTQGLVPIDIDPGLQPDALGLAALYGFLTALPFVLWPLGRAQQVRAAELFRQGAEEDARFPPWFYRLTSLAALGVLAAAAIFLSHEHRIAAMTCAALFAIFALFWAVGTGLRAAAAKLPRPARAEVALALANIGGPASLSRTIALSLGAGLTLLTAVSLIDSSLSEDLKTRLPQHAPSYFFIGVPKQDLKGFEDLLGAKAPGARIGLAPMLRGRLVALAGVPVENIKATSSTEWVLNGDRGITYSESPPLGSQVTEGQWWPANYEGEPLVSFEADIAKALGLKTGDQVTVNVLGRNLTARIANLRKVRWGSIDINFVMIFSPNALRSAPFTYLATLSWPEGVTPDAKAEAAAMRAVTATFPTVSAIHVRDALNAINGIFEKIMQAVRVAGSVTLLMGALVVAGALITAQRRRIYEAVILRTLGASKRRIVSAHLLEYVLQAVCIAAIAAALGLLAAYAIVTFVMGVGFSLSLSALLQPSLLETIFVVVLGALGSLRVLSAKPANYLRSE